MKCWVEYDHTNPAALLSKLDSAQIGAIINILQAVESDSVVPAVRIPMTASSWLGLPTNASATNTAKYPQLGLQYQALIRNLVEAYTSHGIVVSQTFPATPP